MKEKIEVVIPEKMSDYIEGLMYEVNARKNLVAFCIERGMDLEGEVFQRYHKEYVDFTAEYEMAKKEMADTYVVPEYPNCNWQLDFATHTLTIEVI